MYVFEQNTTVHVYSAHFMKPKLGSEEEPQLPTLAFFSSGGTLFDRGSEARNPPPPPRGKTYTHTLGTEREKSKKKEGRWILRGKKGGIPTF